jgi:hypothetical protein
MLFLRTESARLEEEETATGEYKSLECGCLRLPRRVFRGSTRGTYHGRGWTVEIREELSVPCEMRIGLSCR